MDFPEYSSLEHLRRATKDHNPLKLGYESMLPEDNNNPYNKTAAIINRLKLSQVKELREMHIGFGSISCALALLLIIRIWHDSWRSQKLNVRIRPRRFAFLYDLHPAESFPLILGFTILVQEVAFVGIQAGALKTIFVTKCRKSSQIVFTQIFIVGWFHFVFGLDMTIRCLKPSRFGPRRKFVTPLCILLAWVLTVFTWLSTRIRPPGNRCYGDMIFRSIKSSLLGIVLCGFMIPSFILMALIIGAQLHRTVLMDQNERIAGTRMVYYLVLTAILYTMIIPFWIQAVTQTFDDNLTSSRVAEFVLFISGAVIAFTHFFLRANAVRTAIRPCSMPWMKRRRFRLFGPSDLELMPISSPMTMMKPGYDEEEKLHIAPWTVPKAGVLTSPTASTPGSFAFPIKPENAATKSQWPFPEASPKTPSKSPRILDMKISPAPIAPSHRNKPSYSLFPGAEEIQLPPTIYSPESPPKSSKDTISKVIKSSTALGAIGLTKQSLDTNLLQPRIPWGPGHRRGSSADSSATVQIGIRFSAAPPPATTTNQPPISHSVAKQIVFDNPNPFADKPLPAPQEILPTLTSAVFDPSPKTRIKQQSQEEPEKSEKSADYAWLEIQDSPTQTDQSQPAYLKRQNSQRELAESNRKDMADLERSATITKPKPRPAYPTPAATPSKSGRKLKGGFF